MSMEVLLKIGDCRKELSVDKGDVVFVVEEELGQLGMDGIQVYFLVFEESNIIPISVSTSFSDGQRNEKALLT